MRTIKNNIIIIALLFSFGVYSQVGIGIHNPDQSAILELSSKKKGFLPPRLTTLERNAIAKPAVGLLIFNTNKNCIEWYTGSGWYNLCGDNGTANIASYSCTTNQTGMMRVGERASSVSQTITVTVKTPGSYLISAAANGVIFAATGNFTTAGTHDIILLGTGIPQASGNHNFTITTGTASCTFSRTTS